MGEQSDENQTMKPDPAVMAWLKAHGTTLYDALGYWPGRDEDMARLLNRVTRSFGQLPGWKDDLDRQRCDTLDQFLRGEPTDEQELRIAVDLLRVAFNMAVDEIGHLKRARVPPRPPLPPRPRPYPMPRR